MKNLILSLSCLILSMVVMAQNDAESKLADSGDKKPTTRALIIGVSNYANLPLEYQLDYADKDAIAFYTFLWRSPDLVARHNISIFLNEQATNKNQIISQLNTYYNESVAGDLLIFYFAGHGDIQHMFGKDDGFLLLHNVSTDGDYYSSDALKVNDLNNFISGMASKNVNVLLITDACRSGKLISSREKSSRVLLALSQEYENAMKLVSCQANQLSFEGKQWGDGHGVFTYFLIDGLKGKADRNDDNEIIFGELSQYVINSVLEDTKYEQEPEKSGNSAQVLLSFSESMSPKQEEENSSGTEVDRKVAARAMTAGSDYFYDLSMKTRELLEEFKLTIANGAYLNSDRSRSKVFISPEVNAIEFMDPEVTKANDANVYTLSLSNIDHVYLTGSGDKNVRVYDLDNGSLKYSFKHDGVLSSQNDPRGTYFATGGWNQKIQIWNVNDGVKETEFIAHDDDIRAIAYNLSGSQVASGGDDRSIRLWNTVSWENEGLKKNAHAGRINDLVYVDGQSKLISVSDDGFVKLWDVSSLQNIKKLKQASKVNCIVLNKDRTKFVTGDESGKVILRDANSFDLIDVYKTGMKSISSIAVTPNMNFAIVGGIERRLMLLDLRTGDKMQEIILPHGVTEMKIRQDLSAVEFSMYKGFRGSVKLNFELSGTAVVADELYKQLLESDDARHLKDRFVSYFSMALQKDALDMINAFIAGNHSAYTKEEIDRAGAYLDRAIQINAKNEIVLEKLNVDRKLLQAYSILQSNEISSYNKAIKLLEDLIKDLPDASFTHNSLVVFYQKLNELENAKKSVGVAIERIPEWTEPKINLAKTYFLEGEYAKAIGECKNVLESNQNHSKANQQLGDIYMFLGYFSEAEKAYRKAIENDSLSVEARVSMCELQAMLGNFSGTAKYIEEAGILNAKNEDLIVAQARILRYQFEKDSNENNTLELVRNYKLILKAAEENPSSIKLQMELINYHLLVLKNDKVLNEIVLLQIPNARSTNDLRFVSITQRMLSKVLRTNPFQYDAYAGLAYCHAYTHKFRLSKQYFRQITRKAEDSPRMRYLKAKFFLDFQKNIRAINGFKKVLQLDERYSPAIYYLLENDPKSMSSGKGRNEPYSQSKSDLYINRYSVAKYDYLTYSLD